MRVGSKSVFSKNQVVTVGGRPALVTRAGEEGDNGTVQCAWVEGDGSLGSGFAFRDWEAESKGVKVADGAKVRTVVDLPPDLAKAAFSYDVAPAKQVGEWEPETHQSYGTVEVMRVSGNAALFMSPFRHQHYVTLSIRRAQRQRSYSDDRAISRGEIVEVGLSEAQWARMVSSHGLGEGTPCTILHLHGQMMPECPDQATVERFHTDVEHQVAKGVAFLSDAISKAKALLESPTPTKAARKEIVTALCYAEKQLSDGLPFIAQQLRETMASIVEDAKVEVDAYANRAQGLGASNIALPLLGNAPEGPGEPRDG